MDNHREAKGIVFNIQHYSIHDGPGIRTNVFVKGCPLHCLWCANPESQCPTPELMYLEEKCVSCQRCVSLCPQNAISFIQGKIKTDRSRCTACGLCTSLCPTEARNITGKLMTAGEALDEVLADKLFYGSDGGVTITGGEALAHPRFTHALVSLCRKAGISTAIETCGAVSWDIMKPVLAHTDYVLFDIKQMSSSKHTAYTGLGNEQILENIKHISEETDCTLFIRCPVIPGYNEDTENYHALGRFLSKNHIRHKEIHLLAYHNMGEGKRVQLENGSAPFLTTTPEEGALEALRTILRSYGFTAK